MLYAGHMTGDVAFTIVRNALRLIALTAGLFVPTGAVDATRKESEEAAVTEEAPLDLCVRRSSIGVRFSFYESFFVRTFRWRGR